MPCTIYVPNGSVLFARLCVFKSTEHPYFKHGAIINYYVIITKCGTFSKTGLRFTWNKPAGGRKGLLGKNQLNEKQKEIQVKSQKVYKLSNLILRAGPSPLVPEIVGEKTSFRPHGRRLLELLSPPQSPSGGLALLFCAPCGGLVMVSSQKCPKGA